MFQELAMSYMKKLKTILQYNTSKYIHLSVFASFYLLSYTKPFLLIFLGLYLIFLLKNRRSLAIICLLVVFILAIRNGMVNQIEKEPLPIYAKVVKINDDHIIVKSRHKYMAYCDNVDIYKPGMTLFIEGSYFDIDQMHIKHHMNYIEYLKTQNIYGLLSPTKIDVIDHGFSIYLLPYYIESRIDDDYTTRVNTYLKLFLLGDKTSLDQTTYSQAKDIGISHLFAISGMHVGIIIGGINIVLGMFYLRRKTYLAWLIIFIFTYNVITGFSVSIIRASLLALIVFVNSNHFNKLSRTDILSFIFIGFLLYQPKMIYAVGFQLSFLISAIIILVRKNHGMSTFKQLLYISMVSVLFSLPIILSLNHQIGILNIIISPVFILMVSLMLLPGAILVFVYPQLSHIYEYIIHAFENMIGFIHKLNIYIELNMNHWLYVLVYWVLLVWTFQSQKISRLLKFSWLVLLTILFINPSSYLTKVIVFDVNQGDAIYLQSQGCKMLIDTGLPDDYDSILHYFSGENINHLDALILTHGHSDHIGEANDIINDIKVDRVYIAKPIDSVNARQKVILSENDRLSCGQFNLLVISADNEDNNENNNSLVFLMNIFEETWLLTGDIEASIEALIVDKLPKTIDHLKVAHHGSNTSTTDLFLEEISVKNAYISYGRNTYGMPSPQVLEKLRANGASIYSTYDHGSIELVYVSRYRIYSFLKNNKRIIVKTKT